MLPFGLLNTLEPIKVAIEIIHNKKSFYPDVFNMDKGVGFASMERIESIDLYWSLIDRSLRLSICSVEFLLFLLFLYFWISAPRKQEYFYVSSVAFVHFVSNLNWIDFISFSINREYLYILELSIKALEGLSIFMLCLSFCRIKRKILRFTFLIIFIFSISLVVFSILKSNVARVSFFYGQWILPSLCLFGGIWSVLQAFSISEFINTSSKRRRMKRLLAFGFTIGILGIIYSIKHPFLEAKVFSTFSFRLIQLFIILLMATIVLFDYRELETLSIKTPFSKWHKIIPLPQSITGWLLRVDVIRSGRFKGKLTDGQTSYHDIMRSWMQLFDQIVLSNSGDHIFDSGDEIGYFFENNNPLNGFLSAITAVHKMVLEQKNLSLGAHKESIEFCASLKYGHLTPTFYKIGLRDNPSFEGDILVDSARLLEARKKINFKDIKDVENPIFCELSDLEYISIDKDKLIQKELTYVDKDSRKREVALVTLDFLNQLKRQSS